MPSEDPTLHPDEPSPDDSEARSVFVSQLAARLTARDLGYFFEDKLGEGSVMDSRIVTDRISRRSKGYARHGQFTALPHHGLDTLATTPNWKLACDQRAS